MLQRILCPGVSGTKLSKILNHGEEIQLNDFEPQLKNNGALEGLSPTVAGNGFLSHFCAYLGVKVNALLTRNYSDINFEFRGVIPSTCAKKEPSVLLAFFSPSVIAFFASQSNIALQNVVFFWSVERAEKDK